MTIDDRVTDLELRVGVLEGKKADPLADFGNTFIATPTGKITSIGNVFEVPDFTSRGGKVSPRSVTVSAKFEFDDGNQKRLPEWWSSIEGDLGFRGCDVGLSLAAIKGYQDIIVKLNGKELDRRTVTVKIISCDQCGG